MVKEGDIIAGKYLIKKHIGSGGMGKVYLVRHTLLKIDYAIKFLNPFLFDDENIRRKFINEARIGVLLQHPNIVNVNDIDIKEDTCFIVMEYIEGDDLSCRIKNGILYEEEICHISMQILDALGFAHRKGIVHRDIKPSNIMLTREGKAYLTDFGIAKALSSAGLSLKKSQTILTPEFAAPEQISKERFGDVSQRTDIYSLGVTLYYLASGKPPFTGDTGEVLLKHMTETPQGLKELNSELSEGFCAAVERAVKKRQEDRFQSAEEMMKAIKNRKKVIVRKNESLPVGELEKGEEANLEIINYRRQRSLKWIIAIILTVIVLSVITVMIRTNIIKNKVEEKQYKSKIVLNEINTLWKFKTGGSVGSSPRVIDGKVFIGSDDGFLYCLTYVKGEMIWKFKADNSIYSSPYILNRMVYFGSEDCYIYCVSEDSGDLIWKYKTDGYVYSSPIVSNQRLYIGSYDNYHYCLSAKNGELIWRYRTEGDIFSSPFIVNGRVYFGSKDGYVYCLSEIKGELIWRYKTGDIIYSSPIVKEKRLYIGSDDGYIYCLSADYGSLIWKYKTEGSIHSSPCLSSDRIYIGSRDYFIYCLSVDDGKLIWRFKTNYYIDSTPYIYGDYLYFGSNDMNIYCISAKSGEPKWENKADGKVYSSPYIYNERIYIGSFDNYIYCLSEK